MYKAVTTAGVVLVALATSTDAEPKKDMGISVIYNNPQNAIVENSKIGFDNSPDADLKGEGTKLYTTDVLFSKALDDKWGIRFGFGKGDGSYDWTVPRIGTDGLEGEGHFSEEVSMMRFMAGVAHRWSPNEWYDIEATVDAIIASYSGSLTETAEVSNGNSSVKESLESQWGTTRYGIRIGLTGEYHVPSFDNLSFLLGLYHDMAISGDYSADADTHVEATVNTPAGVRTVTGDGVGTLEGELVNETGVFFGLKAEF